MLQVRRTGLIVSDPEKLDSLREEFNRRHAVVLEGFLGPDVLEYLHARIGTARLETRSDYDGAGREFAREHAVDKHDVSMHLISVLLNDQKLFQILERIAACPVIGYFEGRIYVMASDSGHYDTWHGDNGGGRLVGLSVNLSGETYAGGVFQLRERDSRRLCCEILHAQAGNAHLFRIAPELEHRVTPVEGQAKRLVAAGWFNSGPTLREMLQSAKSEMT
jgi:hypothetical protein